MHHPTHTKSENKKVSNNNPSSHRHNEQNKPDYPIDYYRLPFCQPDNGTTTNPKHDEGGSTWHPSAYSLEVGKDVYCQPLCVRQLGASNNPDRPSILKRSILKEFQQHWKLDVPTTSKTEEKALNLRQSFPLGFVVEELENYVDESSKKAYLYNHFNFHVDYKLHKKPTSTSHSGHHTNNDDEYEYEVVHFEIEPLSTSNRFTQHLDHRDDVGPGHDSKYMNHETRVEFISPMDSCLPDATQHTTGEMVVEHGTEIWGQYKPQGAQGLTVYTYDVIWRNIDDADGHTHQDGYSLMSTTILAIGFSIIVLTGAYFLLLTNITSQYQSRVDIRRNKHHQLPVWSMADDDENNVGTELLDDERLALKGGTSIDYQQMNDTQ